MPRILAKKESYAEEDFRVEIRMRQGQYDLMSQQALADQVGIPRPTLRKRLLELETMNLGELRKIVKVLWPDPVILLKLIGYEGKDIRKALAPYMPEENKKSGDACQHRRQSPIEWR